MRIVFALLLLCLAACAEAPRLDLPVVAEGPAPALIPIEPLLAEADGMGASPRSGFDTAGTLAARAAALQARAARLRGAVIPAPIRARMRAGIVVPAGF